MRAAVAVVSFGILAGCAAGAVLGAVDVFAVERYVSQGLVRLALERGGALAAAGGAIGALGAGFLLAGVALLRPVLRRFSPPLESGRARAAAALERKRLALAAAALAMLVGAGAAWGGAQIAASRKAAGRPNVLLVVMDTVRADRLSGFGYARPTTPELDAFAAEAIRFPQMFSTSAWTLPGHASIFTGTYPEYHGATQGHWSLERRHTTLAEILRDAGYRTFAASANPIVGSVSHLDQGFAQFRDVWRESGKIFEGGPPAHPVNRAFANFLHQADRNRPFFVFLNYMDAHRPYVPPAEYLARMSQGRVNPLVAARVGDRKWYELYLDGPGPPSDVALTSDLYDAELAFLSASVGALLDELRRDGRYDDTLIAITADHGEHLGEHGLWDHVFSLYEPLLHVPLLLRLPRGVGAGTTDSRMGQLTDLLPTILAVCGIEAPRVPVQGRNLLDPARAERVLASYDYPHQALAMIGSAALDLHRERLAPYLRGLRALRAGDLKLIEGSDGRVELFDLGRDPDETHDLAAAAPRVRDELRAQLAEAVARVAAPGALGPSGPVDTGDRQREAQLRALGYVR